MKKLFALLLLSSFSQLAFATLTFTLVSNPCDTNKIIAVSWTGGTAPYDVYWKGSTTASTTYGNVHHTVSTNTDTLYHYTGGKILVIVYSGVAMTDSTTYPGSLPFTFTFSPNLPHCTATSTASVTITGGTAPFTCYWYPAYTPSSISGTGNPITLPNGSYGITIVDAAGCVSGSNSQANTQWAMPYWDTIEASSSYSVAVTSTPASCTNGTASVLGVSGATPPINYLWSNGATSSSITGLTGGSYSVNITDALGCIGMGWTYISQTPNITVPVTPTPATCVASDGGVIAFGSGGTPPYTYLWSNGATTQSQSGLPAGPYSVTATDANGCKGTGSGTVAASTPITVTYTATPSLCTSPTGTASIVISGGTPPYTDTFFTSPLQTGVNATNLAPGTYNFRVTDAAGCKRSGSVVIPPINIINLSFTSVPALCTLANGSINSVVSGGSTPYTYVWSTGATTAGLSSKPAGYYSVTVTDNDHCAVTKSGYITSYSPVSLATTTTPASCIFTHDGTASATAYGGTAPYTYAWSGVGPGSSVSSLASGSYYVSVTDANGCYRSANTYVGYNAADSSCFCVIKGTVYNDLNGNCIQDAGEGGLWNIQIYCSGIGYTYTDSMGRYSFIVPAGSYTIQQTVLAYYPLAACQTNNIPVTVSSTGAGCSHIVDFANTISPIHEVRINTSNANQPVPGNNYRQAVVITNSGTVTESNILAGYYTDGQLFSPTFLPAGTFNAVSPTWYNTTGGTPISLTPGASAVFYPEYSVPTYIPMGTALLFKDTVAYAAPLSNWLTDYAPWNNVSYYTPVVVSSYDPNFIEVNPKGAGTPGNITYNDSILTYTVHFQNTGTYMAQNVVVKDTLDPDLDWATLRPVYSSASSKITLSTTGELVYTFKNINLPPASSQPVASNGMFIYTIKRKNGLPLGTEFKNKVSIYFDYNAPVVTNTTLNTLLSPTAAAPTFTGGPSQSLSVCANSPATSINTLLAVSDADMGETLAWSTQTAPTHGTLVASYAATSAGITITPTGLTYAPAAGYAGPDAFTVQVTDGTATVVTTVNVTVTPLPDAGTITGLNTVCTGFTINLSNDATIAGVWSSSSATASVSASGVVSGIAAGATTISYAVTNSCGSATATYPITVNPSASAGTITGANIVCTGSSVSLSSTTPGGVWSSANTNISVTGAGVVSGITTGIAIITYTFTNSCGNAFITRNITVTSVGSAGTITGVSSLCAGTTISLSNSQGGGAWTSSGAFASINSFGTVTGISGGAETITYTVTNSCGSASTSAVIHVMPLPVPGIIGGPDTVCIGEAAVLSNSVSGGTWSTTSIHTSVTSAGIVTGVTQGVDTIKYTVTNSCGSANATHAVVVKDCDPSGTNMILGKGNNLEIYPNPNTGIFSIKCASTASGEVKLVITNVAGEVVKEAVIPTNQAIQLRVDAVPGIYSITIHDQGKVQTKKLIITK